MVHYAIDTEPRSRVHFCTALLALLISLGVPYVLADLNARVLVPSAFAVYGLLLFGYNKWLWKRFPFTLLSAIPNINGRYKGTVQRPSEDQSKDETFDVEAVVTQTWTKIDIVIESDATISTLTVCGFYLENEDRLRVLSSYNVRDRVPKTKSNSYGEGSQDFVIETGPPLKLHGQYYSTKPRRGYLSLTRVDG